MEETLTFEIWREGTKKITLSKQKKKEEKKITQMEGKQATVRADFERLIESPAVSRVSFSANLTWDDDTDYLLTHWQACPQLRFDFTVGPLLGGSVNTRELRDRYKAMVVPAMNETVIVPESDIKMLRDYRLSSSHTVGRGVPTCLAIPVKDIDATSRGRVISHPDALYVSVIVYRRSQPKHNNNTTLAFEPVFTGQMKLSHTVDGVAPMALSVVEDYIQRYSSVFETSGCRRTASLVITDRVFNLFLFRGAHCVKADAQLQSGVLVNGWIYDQLTKANNLMAIPTRDESDERPFPELAKDALQRAAVFKAVAHIAVCPYLPNNAGGAYAGLCLERVHHDGSYLQMLIETSRQNNAIAIALSDSEHLRLNVVLKPSDLLNAKTLNVSQSELKQFQISLYDRIEHGEKRTVMGLDAVLAPQQHSDNSWVSSLFFVQSFTVAVMNTQRPIATTLDWIIQRLPDTGSMEALIKKLPTRAEDRQDVALKRVYGPVLDGSHDLRQVDVLHCLAEIGVKMIELLPACIVQQTHDPFVYDFATTFRIPSHMWPLDSMNCVEGISLMINIHKALCESAYLDVYTGAIETLKTEVYRSFTESQKRAFMLIVFFIVPIMRCYSPVVAVSTYQLEEKSNANSAPLIGPLHDSDCGVDCHSDSSVLTVDPAVPFTAGEPLISDEVVLGRQVDMEEDEQPEMVRPVPLKLCAQQDAPEAKDEVCVPHLLFCLRSHLCDSLFPKEESARSLARELLSSPYRVPVALSERIYGYELQYVMFTDMFQNVRTSDTCNAPLTFDVAMNLTDPPRGVSVPVSHSLFPSMTVIGYQKIQYFLPVELQARMAARGTDVPTMFVPHDEAQTAYPRDWISYQDRLYVTLPRLQNAYWIDWNAYKSEVALINNSLISHDFSHQRIRMLLPPQDFVYSQPRWEPCSELSYVEDTMYPSRPTVKCESLYEGDDHVVMRVVVQTLVTQDCFNDTVLMANQAMQEYFDKQRDVASSYLSRVVCAPLQLFTLYFFVYRVVRR